MATYGNIKFHARSSKAPNHNTQITNKFQISISNFKTKNNHESTKGLKHENRKDKFRAFKILCFRDENKFCHVAQFLKFDSNIQFGSLGFVIWCLEFFKYKSAIMLKSPIHHD